MYFEAFAGDSLVGRQHALRFHIEADGRRLGIRRLDDPALVGPVLDLTRLRRTSLSARKSKVSFKGFASPVRKGSTFAQFLDGLPGSNVPAMSRAF